MAKKKKRRRHGTSLLGLMRAGLYGASIAAPGVDAYMRGVAPAQVLTNYAGYDIDQGRFRWDLVARYWTPLVAWSAIDFGLSKFGVYRRAGRVMKALSF
jgi:hypothetical protein